MKKIILLLIIILFYNFTLKKNHNASSEFKSNPKRVETFFYDLKKKENLSGIQIYTIKEVQEFDSIGRETNKASFSPNDKLEIAFSYHYYEYSIYEYKYVKDSVKSLQSINYLNHEGEKISKISFFNTGLISSIKTLIDNDETNIYETKLNYGDSFGKRLIEKYNSDNKIIEELEYNGDKIKNQSIYEYDSNGNKIGVKIYRYNKLHLVHENTFDINNNEITNNLTILIESDTIRQIQTSYIYEYDKRGNYISKIEQSKEPKYLIKRKIEYWD